MFGAECNCSGDVFMQDSWSSRRSEIAARMSLRGSHMAQSQLSQEPEDRQSRLQTVLNSANASSRSHGAEYDRQYLSTASDLQKQPYFSDWEQTPSIGKSRAGPKVPCLLTHGMLFEHRDARIMTINEVFAVQGWGTLPSDVGSFRESDVLKVIQRAGCMAHAKKFIGNSMHIPTITAVLLYVFCHVVRDRHEKAWLVNRASSWNLEVCSGADAANEDKDKEQPQSSSKRSSKVGSAAAWKRMKSSTFDE